MPPQIDLLQTIELSRTLAERGQSRRAAATLATIPDEQQSARVLGLRATLLRDLGEIEACRAMLSAAVERAQGPLRDALRLRRALALPPMMSSRATMMEHRDRMARELDEIAQLGLDFPSLSDLPTSLGDFYLPYHGEDDLPLRQRQAKLLRASCPELSFIADHCRLVSRPTTRRARIGFVSSHFRDHTILLLQRELIAGLDRTRFEVHAFFVEGITDAAGQALADRVEHAHELDCDLSTARERIAAAELDVLVFADLGMDAFTYYLAFARLAPTQCATWGHPVTSGLSTIDWFLTSETLDPKGNERFYTERLARLPDPMLCYTPATEPASVWSRATLGLGPKERIYVCAQSLFKLHPDFDRTLAEILERDRSARLVLSAPKQTEWTAVLQQRLEALGVRFTERVVIAPPMPRADYLAMLRAADVVLDPFHFGGGNTSLEALAVGAPMVTLPSTQLRGRLTLSWLQALGVLDTVADSPRAYVELALRIAGDRSLRDALSRTLLARGHRLFGRSDAIAAYESFFAAVTAPARGHEEQPPTAIARPGPGS